MTTDLNTIHSIKDLEQFIQDSTHFQKLGITSTNTMKQTSNNPAEAVQILQQLSNTQFGPDITNVALIYNGHRPLTDAKLSEADFTSLINNIRNHLTQSSNNPDSKLILVIDDKQEKGFSVVQNNSIFSLSENNSKNSSLDFSISYSNNQFKNIVNITRTEGDKGTTVQLQGPSGDSTLTADSAENSSTIILGDIKTVFDQVGLDFHPLS